MVDHLFEVYRRSPTRRARLQSLRWCLWTVPDDVSNMWSRQPITVSTQYRFQQNIFLTRWVSQSKALDGQIPLQSSLSAVKFYKFFCSVLRAVHQSADMYPGLRSHRYQSHLSRVTTAGSINCQLSQRLKILTFYASSQRLMGQHFND